MTRGRTPQEGSINRNPLSIEWAEVENTPYTSQKGKPKIPGYRTIIVDGEPVDVEWQEESIQWWKAVSTMPHCSLWTPAEWQFAKATLYLADSAFRGDTRAFGELRQREAKMGTTREARNNLRIRYVEPSPIKNAEEFEEATGVSVTNEERKSRRQRLLNKEA